MDIKTCNKCHQALPYDRFHKDKYKKDGHCGSCKNCNGERAAKWQAATRERNTAWLNDLKSQPCVDCNQSFPPVCMDFDHRESKEEIVSKLVWTNTPKARILEEIAKCDLVCSNCHRIRTFIERKQCGAPRKYDRSNW